MATVTPHLRFECTDAEDFAAAQAFLDNSGYTVGETVNGLRVDDAVNLTIEVTQPTWSI